METIALVQFTDNIQHYVPWPEQIVHGDSVRTVRDVYFEDHPADRDDVRVEQGELRRHMRYFDA